MRLTITLFIIFMIGGTILFLTKNHEIEKEQLKIEQRNAFLKQRGVFFNERLASISDGVLNLSNLDLNTLPDSIANYKNIRVLDLSYNNFEAIPDVLHFLPNVETLILSHNQFSSLNINLNVNAPLNFSIKNLDLSHNYIDDIGEIFTHFGELETLSLEHNNLSSYLGFKINYTLKKLNISHNMIYTIRTIDNLKGLKEVNISHNEMRELSMYMPASLEKFNCSFNKLKYISWTMDNLEKLREIDLSYNEIEVFYYTDFISNIEILNLSHNDFYSNNKGFEAFSKYQKLKKLDLSSCDIKHSTKIDNNFRALEYLNIANNEIDSLIVDNDNLTYLNISKTDIILSDQKINAPNLETFDITSVFVEERGIGKLLNLPKLKKLIANGTILCNNDLKAEITNRPEISVIVCD